MQIIELNVYATYVKWICRTLAGMKEQVGDHENRLRAIEGWRHTKIGEEQRMQLISAGGLVGGKSFPAVSAASYRHATSRVRTFFPR